MAMFLVAGILVGAILGLRFNIVILIPVTCAALTIAAVEGTAGGESFWYIASTVVLVVTALQLGYLGGSAIVSIIGSRRASNRSSESISTGLSRPI
jgi:hypothetical protein